MRVFRAQLLCISALLSPPKSLAHVPPPPGIRLIQGDISFAILITARCRWKQNISANERLRDVSGGTLPPARKRRQNGLLCVLKKKTENVFLLSASFARNTPQQKHNCSQSRLGFRLPRKRGRWGCPVALLLLPFEPGKKTGDESRCGFVQRRLDLC